MRIPLQLIAPSHILKVVNIRALINSGTDISCIDWQFVRKHSLPTTKLDIPIKVQNVDQTSNKSGEICFTCTLFTNIKGIAQKHLFHVMSCGRENLILGLPWLQNTNPIINWSCQTLSISETCDQSKELYAMHTSNNEHYNTFFRKPLPRTPRHVNTDIISDQRLYEFLHYETKDQYIACAKQNRARYRIIRGDFHFILGSLVIAKLTTATELAAAAEKAKPPVILPKEFQDFAKVFAKEAMDHIPPPQPYDHEINLDKTFIPKIGKIYPLSPEEKKAMEDFLEENLASGKIRPSNSSQASPFFFVKKKDGKLHPCQDYCYLNEHTIHDAYPLPLISDLVDKLKDARYFTKFDVRWGYNNVHIKNGHQWKVAFITHKGLFEPMVMFFGLNNSPATFQRFMNDSFRDMIAEGWLIIYMDDLLIFTPDKATHIQRTHQVLQWMTELDLHLKLEKCQFASTEVEYLGMIVKLGQLAMDPVKLDGIASWPTPTKVREVRSFLDFANFYCCFIPDYSTIACPLLNLTKKDHCWDWTPEVQTSFDNLKQLFLSKPILQLSNFSKLFAIATNASRDASGAILLQTDSNGDWHPCSYLSQTFSPTE